MQEGGFGVCRYKIGGAPAPVQAGRGRWPIGKGSTMVKDTCQSADCSTPAAARGYCARHYGVEYRAGRIVPLPPNPDHHRLSDVDTTSRTAVCSVCGPTKIRIRNGNRGHECMVKRNLDLARRGNRKSKNPPSQSGKPRRRQNLRTRYGITEDEYDAMLEGQGGVCAICGSAPSAHRKLAIDHDHATGAVRGLLCMHCNVALGFFRDNTNALASASYYLVR